MPLINKRDVFIITLFREVHSIPYLKPFDFSMTDGGVCLRIGSVFYGIIFTV